MHLVTHLGWKEKWSKVIIRNLEQKLLDDLRQKHVNGYVKVVFFLNPHMRLFSH